MSTRDKFTKRIAPQIVLLFLALFLGYQKLSRALPLAQTILGTIWILGAGYKIIRRICRYQLDPVLPKIALPATYGKCPESSISEGTTDDSGGKLSCFDPANLQFIGQVEIMSREQVDKSIAKARAAQGVWSKTTFAERRAVLRAIQEYYVDNMDAIARVCIKDSGKTKLDAILGEIIPTCEKISWILEHGEDVLASENRGGHGLMTMHKRAVVEYLPLGVLGVIAPFNYPCHNFMNHIISGIFAGNAVVVKPSEHTSWSAEFLLQPVKDALSMLESSPSDLVQVVTGLADTGRYLVEGDIDKLIFTGSDKVGRAVMKSAAERLCPVVLELGGKDPFVVCEDVDLSVVVPIALRGVFQNAGQNCIGVERIFAHEDIHDKFVSLCVERVRKMRQGLPLKNEQVDIGAMTMPGACDYLQSLVNDAVTKGATLHCGGLLNNDLLPGQCFKPTVLTGISCDMRIATEEVFGPVMAIWAWDSEQNLTKMANNCPYALGCSVFSADQNRGNRIARKIKSGMVNINDFGSNYLLQSLPFGGTRCSGFGKFAGPEGLRECCLVKSKTEDRIPGVHTALPGPLVYPVGENSDSIAKGLVDIVYGFNLKKRVFAVINLVSGLINELRIATNEKKLA